MPQQPHPLSPPMGAQPHPMMPHAGRPLHGPRAQPMLFGLTPHHQQQRQAHQAHQQNPFPPGYDGRRYGYYNPRPH